MEVLSFGILGFVIYVCIVSIVIQAELSDVQQDLPEQEDSFFVGVPHSTPQKHRAEVSAAEFKVPLSVQLTSPARSSKPAVSVDWSIGRLINLHVSFLLSSECNMTHIYLKSISSLGHCIFIHNDGHV